MGGDLKLVILHAVDLSDHSEMHLYSRTSIKFIQLQRIDYLPPSLLVP